MCDSLCGGDKAGVDVVLDRCRSRLEDDLIEHALLD